jgi:hypothetical protein
MSRKEKKKKSLSCERLLDETASFFRQSGASILVGSILRL